MGDLLISNGMVYDPANNIDGERLDIVIRNGRIRELVPHRDAKVIDATGMIVVPGGIDIHAHIAGPKVNAGRLLRPEDHMFDVEKKGQYTRSGVGHSVPSTFSTGYRYARMGYTTVMEAAVPPIKARHTHGELDDTPLVDKACYPVFGNNWRVMEYLGEGKVEECANYVAWMLNMLKGYAIKVVNPGGVEAWGWGGNVKGIDDSVPEFGITPRDIVRGLCCVNRRLGLPHTVHLHANNLGEPGNYKITLDTMRSVENLSEGEPVLHLTHVQFNAFRGEDWSSLSSAAPEIVEYVNAHSGITLDMGQIIFTNTTTMTSDGPFQYMLHNISGNKWVNSDIEAETGGGVVPYTYKSKNYVNAVQWSIGLEIALMIRDLTRIVLTTDHPNAGPFTEYPQIMSWLISKHARKTTFDRLNRRAAKRSYLEDIEREFSLDELFTITRYSPAKILGLVDKGHLGTGADGDIAIYDIDPKALDPSRDFCKYEEAFRSAAYTIKDGVVVARNGVITAQHRGRTMWVKKTLPTEAVSGLESEMAERFDEHYTIRLANYGIADGYITNPFPIQAEDHS